ncbi:HTH-type transcriptional activator CmpR [Tepidimonas alkaliphilus]|uniref:HTH-type transcriptional activator CmpR n=1 Tax=Tepidimonas alkaliphilus TaxID=2588942 RepID=A0A554WA59_9BURK|nr:LysR family transcriptional regulator [Tepidimonas alkaliphilus]TSE20442.1 HTH-type transcriptional activator CmpR [Tepidimonas alkaliphilus]
MMHISLRQLRAFEAVARLRSFSRAAEELCVTQPTVSKQIRLLHEEVGLPLLEQVGKKIYLTDLGEALYATCSQWLDSWSRFEQTVADHKGVKQGRLRIAAVTTTQFFMPRLLGPFCAEYPGVDVALEVLNRDRVLERLARNQDDLYIMGVPPQDWEIEYEPFLPNELVVLAAIDHPLVAARPIPLQALANEPFIARERGSGTRLTTEQALAAQGLAMRVRMELGSNEAIKQAVAGGLGVAVLSRSTLGPDLRAQGLALLDVEGFPIRRHWYVVRLKDKPLSVVAQTFLAFLRSHIAWLQRCTVGPDERCSSPADSASPAPSA